ncbi:MAG: hypothetical protein WD426_08085 [Anditalea sp.]
MKNKLMAILFCFAFLKATIGLAQYEKLDQTYYFIQTKDGNEYMGTILSEDGEKLVLLTENLGEITLFLKDIVKRTEIKSGQMINGKYWFENPQASRYFWSPNGYGLKKGEWYYQNVWIFFNQVSTGVTNNFSIGAGIVPLFLFSGASTPVWITPKLSLPVIEDKLNLGAGGLLGAVIGEQNSGFGILYGLSTFGSKDRNMTLGLGWGYVSGEIANRPTITLSGMVRTGARGYFLTENYYIHSGDFTLGLISAGGRRIIKNVGLDFGLAIPLASDMDTFIAIPWLGFTVPFGDFESYVE